MTYKVIVQPFGELEERTSARRLGKMGTAGPPRYTTALKDLNPAGNHRSWRPRDTRKPFGSSPHFFEVGSAQGLSDGELLQRYLVGGPDAAEAAFTALVERHGPMVLLVCDAFWPTCTTRRTHFRPRSWTWPAAAGRSNGPSLWQAGSMGSQSGSPCALARHRHAAECMRAAAQAP